MYHNHSAFKHRGDIMTPGHFLQSCQPIKMQYEGRTVTPLWVTEDGTRCRWVIRDKAQRLRMRDAIAKDIHVMENHVFPWNEHGGGIEAIEVLDMVDGYLYTISVEDFMSRKEVLTANAGDQYMVDRQYWDKERVANAAPEQGEFTFA